ncbi:DNA repair protein RecN [Ottowia sp.]|uniref:DNA repair protein RecN n=1 Tax=Ottowia sp. TaxID=1898956 RepID=UPI003A849E4F
MALRHLSLRDFVIVPELDLALHDGFTALTGETGAGKSILVDALQLVLGGRGEAIWVREGQPRCEISAEFDTPTNATAWLQERGFDDQTNALLLRRTIDAAGKSRAWINGSPATVGQLRELAEGLTDIHGQHAWQSLTRPAAVRQLLDAYAGANNTMVAAAWQTWQQAQQALNQARTAQDSLAAERERLLWQISELDKLAPTDGEWDDLSQCHTRLSHAQALMDAAQAAVAALEGSDTGNGSDSGSVSAVSALAQAQHALEAEREVEPEFASLLDVLQSCQDQARDAAHSLNAYLRRADLDPEQLAALDTRMAQWMGLARRFRRPPAELATLLAEWRQALARLEASADLAQLEQAAQQAQRAYQQAAQQLSQQRAEAAPRLAHQVSTAMQQLGMAGGRFQIGLERLAEPASHGLESVTFMVAAHDGSTPRAIEKIASGGELSRLALAIGVCTSQLGTASTLVFDEVDSGVGGAVAATVGQLLHALGRDRQVLCVTHLPQVAACADHHLLVSKQSGHGSTTSQVDAITGEARTREVARMLGGERISDTTLAHALELLQPVRTAQPSQRARKART